jgi:hypothetical protein
MIMGGHMTGRGSGSGKYSFQSTSEGTHTVVVSHMPEDTFSIRIVFQSHGETSIPVVKLGTTEAELLWASLNRMASDLGWKDELYTERIEKIVAERDKK